jgi:serine O-acetyltransferase
MSGKDWTAPWLRSVKNALGSCELCSAGRNTRRGRNLPGQGAVRAAVDDLVALLFPGCHGRDPIPDERLARHLEDRLRRVARALRTHVQRALQHECRVQHGRDCSRCGDCARRAEAAVSRLMSSLPAVRAVLEEDLQAAYEGDPAARSTMEVVLSYPGVYAITVHRLAHELYAERVPLIPRVMSEYAHSATGIDIHPGAKIGPGFFIDHGTGVVIGETAVLGRRVKLYQGVTLGALSFEKDEQGRLVKGIKRHPNVEDHVVIYAGATILGGDTTIGHHSEIGGNVWLTHSVPPHSRVYNQQPRPLIRQKSGEWKAPAGWNDAGGGI